MATRLTHRQFSSRRLDRTRRRMLLLAAMAGAAACLPRRAWGQTTDMSSFDRTAWLFRTAYAQPIPLVNHSKYIPAIQTPLPGLYFASMSQVYPWDRGTNYAVREGRRIARLTADWLLGQRRSFSSLSRVENRG